MPLVGRPSHVNFAIFAIITQNWYPIYQEEFTREADWWVDVGLIRASIHQQFCYILFVLLLFVWDIQSLPKPILLTIWNIRVQINLKNDFIARMFGDVLKPYHLPVLPLL